MNLEQTFREKIERTIDLEKIDPQITEYDEAIFREVTQTDLGPEQRKAILEPVKTYPAQTSLLAVHWHPETIPFDLIEQRIDTLFPNAQERLIIPTQHNEILTYDHRCGVEVDCYSKEFNLKVQLLIHFDEVKKEKAGQLERMLEHTFKYRSSQLLSFIHTILDPDMEDRLEEAISVTGAKENLVAFVRIYTQKIKRLIDQNITEMSPQMLKNKLLRNFFDRLRDDYSDMFINRAQVFLKAVKKIVKRNFNFEYFYRTQEIIEEARSVGAGIVVPHPEQFWPILLADYDVDGYEVWNPQSQEYTEFLINAVERKNKESSRRDRRLLVFMGDDCHFGEKIKPQRSQDPAKVAREIGVQPAWDDPQIAKALIAGGFDRAGVIREYRERL